MAPSLAELVLLLRAESQDGELRCLSEEVSRVLFFESSWEGYVRVYQKLSGKKKTLASLEIDSVQPVFDLDYAERVRKRDRMAIENFVRIYGPLFKHVIDRESQKYKSGMDASSVAQLQGDIWQEFFAKIERVIELYDRQKGSQTGYLYQVIVNLASDHQRKVRRRREDLVDPTRLKHAGSSSDPRVLVESRDFVLKVMESFQRECEQRHQRTVPDDWQLCEMHHLRGVSKESLCQQFSISSSNFDVRMMRIRKRLAEIINRLKS